jgi:hypothetical protein
MIKPKVIWDPKENRSGNVQHIARKHSLTVTEVEEVLLNPRSRAGRSRSTGLPMVFGWTSTGRYITVIWVEISDDPLTIMPVTSYDVRPPKGRRR